MRVEQLSKELRKIVNPYTVFICIGSKTSKLNSAGPEIGSALESMNYIVYGTKERPYTSDMLEIIERRHKNANIITINCSMANSMRDVGKIRLKTASPVSSPIIFESYFDKDKRDEINIKHYLLSICTIPANDTSLLNNDNLERDSNKNYLLSLLDENISIVKRAIVKAMNYSEKLIEMKEEIQTDEMYLEENIKKIQMKLNKIQDTFNTHRYYKKGEIQQLNADLNQAQRLLIQNGNILKKIDDTLCSAIKNIDKSIY
jgi:hypothetical protein